MRFFSSYQKMIAVCAIFTFCSLLGVTAYPLHAQEQQPGQHETNLTKTQEKPGAVETQGTAGMQKSASFPWLIVIAGVVVVGVLLYFLVLAKKNYTLTVTTATGISGTPAAGTTTYSSGTAVNYAYTAQSGYTVQQVTLDGAVVSNSGSITMDKNHTLAVTAGYNIAGTWAFTYTTPYVLYVNSIPLTSNTAVFTAGGSSNSGTWVATSGFSGSGTYTVSGQTVTIILHVGSSGDVQWTGQFSSKDALNGTVIWVSYPSEGTGNWTATRTSTSTHAVPDAMLPAPTPKTEVR